MHMHIHVPWQIENVCCRSVVKSGSNNNNNDKKKNNMITDWKISSLHINSCRFLFRRNYEFLAAAQLISVLTITPAKCICGRFNFI